MEEKNKHPHYGHRQRLKDEFLLKGIDAKADHEILEIMLFYSIPHGDTNEIAHDLIKRFGSLKAVIDAPYDELQKIKGIKAHTASFITFVRLLVREYFVRDYKEGFQVDSKDDLNNLCKALFVTADVEEVHCIYFDNRLQLIDTTKLCEGALGQVDLSFRKIVEEIFRMKCSRVVLTHNHPYGSAMPSREDLNATVELWKVLKQMEIELLDHVIIGRDGEWSMRHNHTLPQIWRD